ncbi:MAG: hypothetical protein IKN72_08800 [Clostridia bacterium]|nr:hypothetical protein [Clostridia bacterium]MBR3553469.1 hypothetical protein [Clostridia bacterium]
MKKILAVLLALLSLVSVFSVAVAALDADNPFGIDTGDEKPLYIIIYKAYDKTDKVTYMPAPTYSYTGPRYLTVTKDTPVAAGKEFQYWVDDEGNTYNPGQEVWVEKEIHLYAIFSDAPSGSGKEGRVLDMIKAGFDSIVALFRKILVALHILNA